MVHDHSGGPYPADDPTGRTHGSAWRPAHPFARPLLTVDLDAEATPPRAEETWGHGARHAKTPVKRREDRR